MGLGMGLDLRSEGLELAIQGLEFAVPMPEGGVEGSRRKGSGEHVLGDGDRRISLRDNNYHQSR